ncbi:hypothetical protein F4806DRAFT_371146 [Annulohypoxylon nitens]|nr:hypothetical protein F4806DRAFT_371146 [Annulohypoxylon nitens]
MSFGFGVGDFLAVGRLAAEIISSLKDSGGSRTEFQDLIRELECLQAALIHLDKLTKTKTSEVLDAIKYAALSCRRPLEEFLYKIRKYETSLGTHSKRNSITAIIDTIKFPLAHKDEIQRLQTYLNVHIGTINILLVEYGLEKIQLETATTEASQLKAKQLLEDMGNLLGRMQTSLLSQTRAVLGNIFVLERIYRMLNGELRVSIKHLADAVAKACISTQKIYAVVLEIRGSNTSVPDIRWSFFQDPYVVEDALGRKFPVPSEFDYSLLNTIIKHKFQDGPGSVLVSTGDYELMDAKNRLQILSVESRLRPGSSIIMAVIVSKPESAVIANERCPMPLCRSDDTIAVLGGGRQWQVYPLHHPPCQPVADKTSHNCAVWFDLSKKKLNSLENPQDTPEMSSDAIEPMIDAFKNIKLSDPMVTEDDRVLQSSPQPSTVIDHELISSAYTGVEIREPRGRYRCGYN